MGGCSVSAPTTMCAHCKKQPTRDDLALCSMCQKTGRRGMENIAAFHRDLLSLGAQRVVTRKASGHSDPTGLAASASERIEADAPDTAAYDTKVQLVGWTRALIIDRPQVLMPRDTVEAMAAVLVKRTITIATLPWAGDYLHGVVTLEQRLHKIVQRSRGYWYAGICMAELTPDRPHDVTSCACSCHLIERAIDRDPGEAACNVPGGCGRDVEVIEGDRCARELYAVPGTTHVRCPVCRTNHSVQARRTILLDQAREELLPLGVVAQVCVTLLDGEPSVERLFKRLHKWTERGVLSDYGVRVLENRRGERRPERVYRLGDVLDTLVSDASKAKRGATC